MLKSIILLFCLLSSNIYAEITGVRLEDVKKYSEFDSRIPISELIRRMKKFPKFYFGSWNSKSHLNFFVEDPIIDGDIVNLKVASIVETAQGETVDARKWGGSSVAKFDSADRDNKFEVHMNDLYVDLSSEKLSFELEGKEVIELSDTRFELNVDLKNRRVIVKDSNNDDLKFVFPVGVGAIDFGVKDKSGYSLMTPYYENQFVDTDLNQVSWAHRDDKRYYQGKPFIRFRTTDSMYGGWSQIGFHIKQNAVFKRAYDSHGCMRLRNMDLQALFRVVLNTQNRNGLVRASINLEIDDELDHPMPKINNRIKIVKNGGTKNRPKTIKDSDGLTAIESISVTQDELSEIWSKIEESYQRNEIKIFR